MTDLFKKKFARCEFSPQDMQTISEMTDCSIMVSTEKRAIRLVPCFDSVVAPQKLFDIARRIKNTYNATDVRIMPRYPSTCFSENVWNKIHPYICVEFGDTIGKGFFERSKAEYDRENDIFRVTLRDCCTADILVSDGVDKYIAECIRAQFDVNLKVELEGGEIPDFYVSPKNVEFDRLTREQLDRAFEAEERDANKTNSYLPVDDGAKVHWLDDEMTKCKAGRLLFDVSDPKIFTGKDIPKLKRLIPIRNITDGETVTFVGKMFSIDKKPNYDTGKITCKMEFTDNDASVLVRTSIPRERRAEIPDAPSYMLITGRAEWNKFDKEVVVRPTAMAFVKKIGRQDTYPRKRVELHIHTNMSQLDALSEPGDVFKQAAAWGMPAVAVTDHGNLQAYPMYMKAAKKCSDTKPIYGMEGYLVDDTARAVFADKADDNISFDDGEFIIFDIETTGLSPLNCGITQIGAIKYKGGESIDTFDTLVNPGMPIPARITELTGITDEMVKNAPAQAEAVKSFLDFAGSDMLVAHNASFDVSFIRRVASENRIRFENAYLDTVSLSRYLNPDASNHKLDTLAHYFKLGNFDHHRADADTEMLAQIFGCMIEKLARQGITNVTEMNDAMASNADPRKLRSHHVSILVKNQTGLRNLYKLVSMSYLDYYARIPRIPKTVLNDYREGLIIGSACSEGELYAAITEGKSDDELAKIAEYYDYLEVMPVCNDMYLGGRGENKKPEQETIKMLQDNIRRIISIGKRVNKPVVATGDSHYLEPDDDVYRRIMLFAKGFSDALDGAKLYFRTTDEMIDEFIFLGKEKAEEIVIDNTVAIADEIEFVKPIPDGTFTPGIDGAEDDLRNICYETAKDMYGDPLPELVKARLDKELDSVIKHGYAVLYIIARLLVKNSEEHGYLVGSRGSVGSSVIATFCGVSEVNPLPPHWRCPKCKKSIFITDGSVGSGFDLPDRICECGERMICDGHDIPFETFLGFHGDKAPDIDLNFSGDVQSAAHKFTEVLFGKENIFRAGTVSALQPKSCIGYVKKLCEEKSLSFTRAELDRLAYGIAGVKRTTGQHPGGIVVIPKQYEIYDFTPVQHPADKESSGVITTHFAFEYLHDTLLKLDILGHDVPTFYKVLEEFTGIDVRTIPLNDRKVFELFASPAPLGVKPEAIGAPVGTLGLPEFGTKYVIQMIVDCKPKNFSDLLQISGLSHGTGIWLGNGAELIKNGTCTIDDIIGTRDSIMLYLIYAGLENSVAFKIMESVRKGRGLSPEQEAAMREKNVPEWYIESCKKIEYMFPKAHAAAYTIASLRLGWFKVYHPIAFYATYFTVKRDSFDGVLAMGGAEAIRDKINEIENMPDASAKDKDTLVFLQMVREFFARGFKFLPVDIYKSQAFRFMPEDGMIRLPFSSLAGLGETAAQNIYDAVHGGGAETVMDLQTIAGLNKKVLEILVSNNCLGDMPESNQITLF